ncbi:hypothetical protein PIB30_059929 [Stylosanthes scabra]|uniref:Uncharacterized protein n=1 Tax=Stylosanthes scabra TaxID=79078 RepID=A0ABU6VIT4_9FABA|nr:hypothetical protein [Stylosanthes scabra]
MAENLQGDQSAKGAVQIPRELPFIYRWVTNDVLGTPSALDQQYIDELSSPGFCLVGGLGAAVPGGSCPPWGAATSSQLSLRGPIATPSKCVVVNSLLRVGDRVLGVASGSGGIFVLIQTLLF